MAVYIIVSATHGHTNIKTEKSARNVGAEYLYAGESPKRKHTIFTARQKFEIKNFYFILFYFEVLLMRRTPQFEKPGSSGGPLNPQLAGDMLSTTQRSVARGDVSNETMSFL